MLYWSPVSNATAGDLDSKWWEKADPPPPLPRRADPHEQEKSAFPYITNGVVAA